MPTSCSVYSPTRERPQPRASSRDRHSRSHSLAQAASASWHRGFRPARKAAERASRLGKPRGEGVAHLSVDQQAAARHDVDGNAKEAHSFSVVDRLTGGVWRSPRPRRLRLRPPGDSPTMTGRMMRSLSSSSPSSNNGSPVGTRSMRPTNTVFNSPHTTYAMRAGKKNSRGANSNPASVPRTSARPMKPFHERKLMSVRR